jgi:hypothetical protein
MARAELILQRTVADLLAPALTRAGYGELADRCRSLTTPTELVELARCLRNMQGNPHASALHQSLISALEHAADAGRQWLAGLPTEVVFCAFSAMREIAALDGDRFADKVYRRAAAILDSALALGRQADAAEMEVVAGRMDAAKRAPEAAYRDDGTLIAA